MLPCVYFFLNVQTNDVYISEPIHVHPSMDVAVTTRIGRLRNNRSSVVVLPVPFSQAVMEPVSSHTPNVTTAAASPINTSQRTRSSCVIQESAPVLVLPVQPQVSVLLADNKPKVVHSFFMPASEKVRLVREHAEAERIKLEIYEKLASATVVDSFVTKSEKPTQRTVLSGTMHYSGIYISRGVIVGFMFLDLFLSTLFIFVLYLYLQT